MLHGQYLLTDHAQVRELWVEGSPTKATQFDVAVIHLARCLVQDAAKDQEEQKWRYLQQLHCCVHKTEEDEVRNVEVRSLGQVLGQ